MDNKVLTIIIPAYNVEKYLEEALAPYLKLSDMEALEVLIINDGSKDHTLDIAMEYEENYPHLFKVINKENGGHGSTINVGISYARGKYFKVVDGDDWVDEKVLSLFLKKMEKLDTDMIATGFVIVSEETNEKEEIHIEGVEYKCKYQFADICTHIDYIRMHSSFFKTKIFQDNHITLDEHCFYVDVEHDILPLKWINTIIFYDDLFYQYRIGRPGQSVNFQAMIKNRENHLRVIKRIIKYRKENNLSKSVDNYIRKRLESLINVQYSILFAMNANRTSKKELMNFDKWLLENEDGIYHTIKQKKICLMRSMKFYNYFFIKFLYKVMGKEEVKFVK